MGAHLQQHARSDHTTACVLLYLGALTMVNGLENLKIEHKKAPELEEFTAHPEAILIRDLH